MQLINGAWRRIKSIYLEDVMENKKNPVLLVSAIFGALFVVGIIIFWVYSFSYAASHGGVDFITGLKNIFNWQDKTTALTSLVIILLTVIIPTALVFNILGWIKGDNRHTLIGGILYILCLNLISAPLCIVGFFDMKQKIKNKLLFFTMVYTLIFGILLITFMAAAPQPKEGVVLTLSDYGYVFYSVITVFIGLVFNFFAWKTGAMKAKIIAGIFYVLGLSTVISAVICFISCKDNRKPKETKEAVN